MNSTDVVVESGLRVTQVTGLEKVVKYIEEQIEAASSKGLKKSYENALSNLKAYKSLAGGDVSQSASERLSGQLAGRTRLNMVSHAINRAADEETQKAFALLREENNKQINATRATIRRAGEAVTLKQAKQNFNTKHKEFEDIVSVITGAEFNSLSPKEQRSILKNGWSIWGNVEEAARNYSALDPKAKITEAKINKAHNENKAEFNKLLDATNKTAKNTGGIFNSLTKLGSFGKSLTIGGATAFGARLGNMYNDYYEGLYSSDTPFQYSRRWRADTLKKGVSWGVSALGALAGLWAGAKAGGAAGTAIGSVVPGVGNIVGGIGGAIIGGVGGALATGFAGKPARDIKAEEHTQSVAAKAAKYRGLYGATSGRGGYHFADTVERTTGGIVSAGSIQQLAANSQEFATALAFGGVSDQQLMGLSMLPNTYAAYMAGASQEDVLRAYMADIQGMDPGLASYATKLAGIPDDIRALANNPELANAVLTSGVKVSEATSALVDNNLPGLLGGQFNKAYQDQKMNLETYKKTIRSSNVYSYDPSFTGGEKTGYSKYSEQIKSAVNQLGGQLPDGLVKTAININIDGETKTTLSPVYTTEDAVDAISFAAGRL